MKYSQLQLAKSILYFGCVVLFMATACADNKNNNRPNIIFIMADDHAAQAISSYGSKINKTPNIDRLAKEGVRFTNCFAANALCAPSRATLISGKHCAANGYKLNGDKFDNSQLTFPKLLQIAGYETGLFGKWHLATEPKGFDYFNILPGQGNYFNPRLKDNGQEWQDGTKGGVSQEGYFTNLITDSSIDWLKNREKSKPFCLMLHHKAPHTPHRYPDKYKELYTDDLPLPETFNDNFEGKNHALLNGHCGWSKLDSIIPAHILEDAPEGLTPEEHKQWAYQAFFKGYLRLIAALDDNAGRLLDYLDESGLSENTIVVYTSDNGFFLGDHGLFNKMWMYEESMRLPLLIRYPKDIKPGVINNQLVSILDFAPTFLDYANAPIPEELHGQSIRPLLKGEEPKNWRTSVYYHYYGQYGVPAHNGIRTQDSKLIHFYNSTDGPEWELYNLHNDPNEINNSYKNTESEQDIIKLEKEYEELKMKFDEK